MRVSLLFLVCLFVISSHLQAEPESEDSVVFTLPVDVVRAGEEKYRQEGVRDGCSAASPTVLPELPASGTVDLTSAQLNERLTAAYKNGRRQACEALVNRQTRSSNTVGTEFRPDQGVPVLVVPGSVTRPANPLPENLPGVSIGTVFELGPDGTYKLRELPVFVEGEEGNLRQILENMKRSYALELPGQKLLLNRDKITLELGKLENGLITSEQLEKLLQEAVQPAPQ